MQTICQCLRQSFRVFVLLAVGAARAQEPPQIYGGLEDKASAPGKSVTLAVYASG